MQTNTMFRKAALVVLLLTIGTEISAQSGALAIYGDLKLNVTSQAQDYALQNLRSFNTKIQYAEGELEAYKSSFAKVLEIISTQVELLVNNIVDTEQRLISLELLNDFNKYCVQNHKMDLPLATTVKSSMNSCANSARSSLASIMSAPAATIANMNSYMKSNFKQGLDNCDKLHGVNSLNNTLCIQKVVASADSSVLSYRNTLNTQLQASICSADSRLKQAVDCGFKIIFSSTSIIGEVMNSINNCMEGKELCPPCATIPPPTTPSDKCPNVINVEPTPGIITNATILNPLLDLNLNLTSLNPPTCVELRFQPKPLK